VWALQGTGGPGFRFEPLEEAIVPAAGDHLDRDVAANLGVDGLIHHAHAAAANDALDVIFPDLCGMGCHFAIRPDLPGGGISTEALAL
jgi:hypothetical protein